MIMRSYLIPVLGVLVLCGLFFMPTFASSFDEEACPECGSNDIYKKAEQTNSITVQTDKNRYDHNSIIIVSGSVASLRGDSPATVTVIAPQGNIVTVEQVKVSKNNMFRTTFNTASSHFGTNGVYTIQVQYGPPEVNNKVVVEIANTSEEKTSSQKTDPKSTKTKEQIAKEKSDKLKKAKELAKKKSLEKTKSKSK